MESSIDLINLPHERIEDAANLCAIALADSASYEAIYRPGGDMVWRVGQLRQLLHANIGMIHAKDPSSCYCGIRKSSGQMACFFMLVPNSTSESIGLLDHVWHGALCFPFSLGWQVTRRLLATDEHTTRAKAIVHQCIGSPLVHYELQRMAVHPSSQNQGIGSYCLMKALQERALAGPAVLRTQLEKNVRFYNKW
jgi:ribosomal protein S18 acetylase RimI-like enzyme